MKYIPGISENEQRLLCVLALSENALDLSEFMRHACDFLTVQEVADLLDSLVTKNILMSDTSYDRSEVGRIVYMFASSTAAQVVYYQLEKLESEGA